MSKDKFKLIDKKFNSVAELIAEAEPEYQQEYRKTLEGIQSNIHALVEYCPSLEIRERIYIRDTNVPFRYALDTLGIEKKTIAEVSKQFNIPVESFLKAFLDFIALIDLGVN